MDIKWEEWKLLMPYHIKFVLTKVIEGTKKYHAIDSFLSQQNQI